MFWTILSAISFAWFFYSMGKKHGFEDGIEYYSRRVEAMMQREEVKAILDPPVGPRQPLHGFGSTRPDVKIVK